MSINQLKNISEICMISGMIMMIISGMIFVKLDVYKAWHIITGRRIKERSYKSRDKKIKQNNINDIKKSDANYFKETCSIQEDTIKLCPQEMPDYESNETMVLEDNDNDFKIIFEVTYIHTNEM